MHVEKSFVKYDESTTNPKGRRPELNSQYTITVADYISMAPLCWSVIYEVGYACTYPSTAILQLVSVSIYFLLSTCVCAKHHKGIQAVVICKPGHGLIGVVNHIEDSAQQHQAAMKK